MEENKHFSTKLNKNDWENNKLKEEEGILEYEDIPLTELPAEMPGIEIESEQIGP